jgi:hypothetical protein
MPVSEQVAERLSDLAYDEWLRRFEEEQEACRQEGLDVRKVTAEDRQREFANYLRTVKRIPYQGYSSFDDNSPDPGCHWEVEERQHIYYPAKYRDVSFRKVRGGSRPPAPAATCSPHTTTSSTPAAAHQQPACTPCSLTLPLLCCCCTGAAAASGATAPDDHQWEPA